MFSIDFPEIVIIFGLALVVLGPKKLPGAVAQIGRWVGRARAMARQFREQLEQEVGGLESSLDIRKAMDDTTDTSPGAAASAASSARTQSAAAEPESPDAAMPAEHPGMDVHAAAEAHPGVAEHGSMAHGPVSPEDEMHSSGTAEWPVGMGWSPEAHMQDPEPVPSVPIVPHAEPALEPAYAEYARETARHADEGGQGGESAGAAANAGADAGAPRAAPAAVGHDGR